MDPVRVKIICLEDNLYFNKQLLLHYKIEYPQFYSYKNQNFLNRINQLYKQRAWNVVRECADIFFKTAVDYYLFSIKRDIPIRLFEVYYIPTITYNKNCALSLYYDKYVYTGGAHGQTYRTSDTWDLNNGRQVHLCDLFVNHTLNFIAYLKSNIEEQIQETMEEEYLYYFENYKENVAGSFNNNNFYLTPEGIVIYFQQYDIAPYAAGIPEFLIPYKEGITIEPKCN